MYPLNEHQLQAVHHHGNLLIVAGPGTGKTHTLAYKIFHTLQSQKVDPASLFALTFTNKAANEMKERLFGLLEKEAGDTFSHQGASTRALSNESRSLPFIGTFHALCLTFLRCHGSMLGMPQNFSLCPDPLLVLQHIADKIQIDIKKRDLREFALKISLFKNRFSSHTSPIQSDDSFELDDSFQSLFHHYQEYLKKSQLLDFDDLISQSIELFQSFPEIQSLYQEKMKYLFIDEYQDINHAQLTLIRLLCSPQTMICAIGDPDQAIYAFRGSHVEHFLRFTDFFSPATTLSLDLNYRSTPNILLASQKLIESNTERVDKPLLSNKKTGDNLSLCVFSSPWQEASFITHEIEALLGGMDMSQIDQNVHFKDAHRERKWHFADFAVLYRTNAQGRFLEQAFKKSGLPYQMIHGRPWYKSKEILLILAFLEHLISPEYDLDSFLETLSLKASEMNLLRNIADRLQALRCNFKGRPMEIVCKIYDEFGLKDFFHADSDSTRISGIAQKRHKLYLQFLAASKQFDAESGEDAIRSLLNHYSILRDYDDYNSDLQAVSLMTFHASKGLEFPVVFIAGLEEGVMPYFTKETGSMRNDSLDPSRTEEDLNRVAEELQRVEEELTRVEENLTLVEEERRLFYVGMTRAKEKLYLLHSTSNEFRPLIPSRFLREIPNEYIEKRTLTHRRIIKEPPQLSLF